MTTLWESYRTIRRNHEWMDAKNAMAWARGATQNAERIAKFDDFADGKWIEMGTEDGFDLRAKFEPDRYVTLEDLEPDVEEVIWFDRSDKTPTAGRAEEWHRVKGYRGGNFQYPWVRMAEKRDQIAQSYRQHAKCGRAEAQQRAAERIRYTLARVADILNGNHGVYVCIVEARRAGIVLGRDSMGLCEIDSADTALDMASEVGSEALHQAKMALRALCGCDEGRAEA